MNTKRSPSPRALPHRTGEALARALAAEGSPAAVGYRPRSVTLEVRGVCPACR